MPVNKTPLICGAVYEKEIRGVVHHCLCLGTRIEASGKVIANIHVFGFALERVQEGTEQADEFTLISSPVFEKRRKKKAS
tara:strand:+ start:8108 stop:8347 length:240 start_codon:yes stop_codon:yes gene_type:complete